MQATRRQVAIPISRSNNPLLGRRKSVRLHAAIATLRGNLRLVARHLSLHILWAPAACVGLMLAAAHDRLWFLRRYHQFDIKAVQEQVGPGILAAAAGLALLLALVRRNFWLGWLAALASVLLCRELHFAGTSAGVYVGLAAVAGFGVQHVERLMPFLRHRLAFTLLASAFATYVMTISLDQGAWKFLPGFVNWGVSIEETLESCGHALVLLSIAAAGAIREQEFIAVPNTQSETSHCNGHSQAA